MNDMYVEFSTSIIVIKYDRILTGSLIYDYPLGDKWKSSMVGAHECLHVYTHVCYTCIRKLVIERAKV